MSQDPGVRESPGALVDYAAGVADVLAHGGVAVAIVGLLLGLLLVTPVGGGIVLVLVAVVLPAVAVGLWLEVPARLREQLG
ncbi:hypothetical protein [Halobellus ruber]|uniref:Uncharacterized protein n=1 Tax=Halobellus ruber TaxID=2761102 RepID=A0A7J9SE27_9EURY|nr:hypothetical protein [Halobellus ruber]MBB6644782.1 hypothetical protein [Halobellus ruber]